MSVVPLNTEGCSPSIVTSQDYFDFDGAAILCHNLDLDQLKSSRKDCNISYDLRVGETYRDHRDIGGTALNEDGKIEIDPGMAVIIQTEEWIHIPKKIFGQVSPKVELLQRGIPNTHSKIDPGYKGHLLITVFNLGRKKVKLKRRQKFCSMFFVTVEDGVLPYEKTGKLIPGYSSRGWFPKAMDQILRYRDIVTVLLSGIIAGVISYLFS